MKLPSLSRARELPRTILDSSIASRVPKPWRTACLMAACGLGLALPPHSSKAATAVFNFAASDWGFTPSENNTYNPAQAGVSPWTYSGTAWQVNGADDVSRALTSPSLTLAGGPVTISFVHTRDFEAFSDGGAVQMSLDGGVTFPEVTNFTSNGYDGFIIAGNFNPLGDQGLQGFWEAPAGGPVGPLTSVASLGTLAAGTLQLQFNAGWDDTNLRAAPNWSIASLTVTGLAALPAEFWKGTVSGSWFDSNWASDAAGTLTPMLPDAPTDVTFSATGATNQNTTLDANFTIHSLTINDTTPVTISSGVNGPFTLTIAGSAGTGITVNSGANLTINSNVTLGGSSDTIAVNGAGVATITGVLGGSNGLIKTGAGALTLSNSGNNYTGATTIQNGTIKLGADNALPTGTTVTINQADGNGNALLDLGGHNQTIAGLTFIAPEAPNSHNSIVDVNGGILTLAGNVSVVDNTTAPGNGFGSNINDTAGTGALDLGNATRTFTVTGQDIILNELSINTRIQGNGGVIIDGLPSTNDGAESGVFFNVANTYTGSTTVAQGRLSMTVSGALPATTDLILGTANSALTGDVDLQGTVQTVNSLSVAAGNTGGAGNFINTSTGGATFIVKSTTTDSTFGGLIEGPILLVKDGAGTTLTLTGANTYGGGTNINAGTLRTQNASALGVGPVDINGGTLALDTSLNVTPVLWSAGFIQLAPGKGTILNSNSSFTNGGGGGAFIFDTTGMTKATYTLVTFVSSNFTVGNLTEQTLNPNVQLQGTFVVNTNNIQFTITGATATGPLLQNSAPVNIPTFADFIVNGPVMTGGPMDNNTVNSLTFLPGSSLTIFNTLTVTTGPVNLVGQSSIDLEQASLAVNQLNILPGGFLGGNGNIIGNLVNAGTVSPGHSPGQIHVTGNYTQTPTGLLQIQIGGRSLNQHDLLSVGGTANLGGTLQLIRLDNFKLKRNEPVTFLTANGGVNGRFATVENDFVSDTILEPTVVYHQDSVALEAVQGSFAKFAHGANLTPNQRSVAQALDSAAFDHRANSLIDYLDDRKLERLPAAFDKIAPEELTSVFTLGVSLAGVQSGNIQRRNDDIRSGSSGFSAAGLALNGAGPSYSGSFNIATGVAGPNGDDGKEVKETKQVTPAEESRWGVFLSGTGEWVSVGNTDNARGYDLSSGGFTLGVDYKVTPNFAIGLAAGYTGSTADLTDHGRVYVNGGKIGLYATFFQNEPAAQAPTMSKDSSKDSSKEAPAPAPSIAKGFYADVAVFGGYNSYDTRRSALQGEARGDTDGGELNALFGAGYDFKAGGLTFGPTASFNYTYLGTNGFTESGSLAPLDVHGGRGESLRSAFGFKASYDWKCGGILIKPEIRAAWQHEYGDAAYSLDSSFASGAGNTFTVAGPQLGRDSALLGAGFAIQCSERCSTYFYYDGELGRKNYQSTAVTGGVRLAF